MNDPKKRENKLVEWLLPKNCSILDQFTNIINWNLQNYQTKTLYMCKFNVGLIGTAPWYLENEQP